MIGNDESEKPGTPNIGDLDRNTISKLKAL